MCRGEQWFGQTTKPNRSVRCGLMSSVRFLKFWNSVHRTELSSTVFEDSAESEMTQQSRILLGGCRDESEIQFKGPAQNRSTRPRLESTRLNPSSRGLTRSDSADSAESMPSLGRVELKKIAKHT